MTLAGRHAVVTGGGRGIGAATARVLTEAGATVTVLGRTEAPLAEQVSRGHAAAYALANVGDAPALAAALEKARAERGPIDILVNNAGAASSAPFLQTGDEDFQAMLAVNLMGAVSATRAVMPDMIRHRFGRIVNIASTASLKGYAYVTAYVAAKHAVLGFTRALALEVATRGVTVNAVCPGFVDTEMSARSIETIVAKTGRDAEAARAALAEANPQRRLVDPAEVAAAVLYLASEGAAAVNGAALSVSGGEV